jgi:hypothetical protein
MTTSTDSSWQVEERFVEIRSRWLTVIGEHLVDADGRKLEYWRVEKADSAIVIPVWQGRLILPARIWRPGLQCTTLDFPGGRVAVGQPPETAARAALERELGVPSNAVHRLRSLTGNGWAVDSSFSSQRLHGYAADLDPAAFPQPPAGTSTFAATDAGVETLLDVLTCLQCRALLLEWRRRPGRE